jgi:hypothetical protein
MRPCSRAPSGAFAAPIAVVITTMTAPERGRARAPILDCGQKASRRHSGGRLCDPDAGG